MKVIPYTTSTGIKMGSRYNESPKPMPIDDPDIIAIQVWLNCSPEWHRQRNMERTVYILFTAFSLIICIAMAVFQ